MDIDCLSNSMIDRSDLILNKQAPGRAGDVRNAERLSRRV
jgi:hypothetical protein